MSQNKVLDGSLGLCTADALGVPVEFTPREQLEISPVTDMEGYGTYNQPPGTWSDDSSRLFGLEESLCEGYNIEDIKDNTCRYLTEAYWTPYGQVFDIGNTTRQSIKLLKEGQKKGLRDINSNGNGSLMCILAMAFYTKGMDEKRFNLVHEVSELTHGHPISLIACGIHNEVAINLLEGKAPKQSYHDAIITSAIHYQKSPYKEELKNFNRILNGDIQNLAKSEIHSGSYVVNTLEAALWCLLNHDDYRDTVLEAVNLGEDTDTTAAVAGGLAGICYGIEGIPLRWIDQLARKQDIIELAERLNNCLNK